MHWGPEVHLTVLPRYRSPESTKMRERVRAQTKTGLTEAQAISSYFKRIVHVAATG